MLTQDQVIIATNGLHGKQFGKFKRRVNSIRSAMNRNRRTAWVTAFRPSVRNYAPMAARSDWVAYYRPSQMVNVYCLAASIWERWIKPQLYSNITGLYDPYVPQLQETKLNYAWSGYIGRTNLWDHVPHIGKMDNSHYAMGYCGSGRTTPIILVEKSLNRCLTSQKGTPRWWFSFKRARYTPKPPPWFLPAIMKWHDLRNRRGMVTTLYGALLTVLFWLVF